MFENIFSWISAYLAVGMVLTYLKFWRLVLWLDNINLEEARGPESDLMMSQPSFRDYYALPYPRWLTLIWHTLLWPLTLIVGVISGIMLFVFWFFMIFCLMTIVTVMFIAHCIARPFRSNT